MIGPRNWNNVLIATKIKAGEILIGIEKRQTIPSGVFGSVMDGDLSAYLIGGIRYTDKRGRPRETSFCRQFNRETLKFERVETLDYEYED